MEVSRVGSSPGFAPLAPTPNLFGLGASTVPDNISVRGTFGHGTSDFVRMGPDAITYSMSSVEGAEPGTPMRANMFAMILMQTYFPGQNVPPGEVGQRATELCRDPQIYAAYQRFMQAPQRASVEIALSPSPSGNTALT